MFADRSEEDAASNDRVYSSRERDNYIRQLNSLVAYEGYATTVEQANRIGAEKERLRNAIHEEDKRLGNAPRLYDAEDRLESVVGGAVNQVRAAYNSMLGTVAGMGNALHEVSSDKDKRVAASDYSGWATDELTAGNIAADMTDEDVRRGMQRMRNEEYRLYNKADKLAINAALDLARSKEGLSSLGKFGVDLSVAIIQQGIDAAGRAVGLGMVPFFVRAAGGAMQEARQSGASIWQQAGYGLTVGGIETAVEKLTGGLSLFFGKGMADDVAEIAISKLAKTDLGRTALRVLFGAAGEGSEEVLSDVLNPFAQLIYNNQALKEAWSNRKELAGDMLYDFIIGSTMGSFGMAANIATGQNAYQNAVLRNPELRSAPQNAIEAQESSGGINTPASQRNAAQARNDELNSAPSNGALPKDNSADTIKSGKPDMDDKLAMAIDMQRNGGSPHEIFDATGLVVMGNGDITSGIGGEILWRYKNERPNETNSFGSERRWGVEAEVPGDDGRGVYSDAGEARGAAQAAKGWGELTDQQRGEVQSEIIGHIESLGTDEALEFLELYDDDELLSEQIYRDYINGPVALEAWSDNLGGTTSELISKLDGYFAKSSGTGSLKNGFATPPHDDINIPNSFLTDEQRKARWAEQNRPPHTDADDPGYAKRQADIDPVDNVDEADSSDTQKPLSFEEIRGLAFEAAQRGDTDEYVRLMDELRSAPRKQDSTIPDALLGDKVVGTASHINTGVYTKGEENTARGIRAEKPDDDGFKPVSDNEHIRHSDEKLAEIVLERVESNGAEAEIKRLMNKDSSSFSDYDMAELEYLLYNYINEKRAHQLAQNTRLRIYEHVELMKKAADMQTKIEEVRRDSARILRQKGQGLITPRTRILDRAFQTLLKYGGDEKAGNFSPDSPNADKIRYIIKQLDTIDSIEAGDAKSIIDEIHELSRYRKTDRVLGGKLSGFVDSALNKVAKMADGEEFLKTLAYAQTDAIITDNFSGLGVSAAESLKNYRIANLLSNVKTWVNNIGNNEVSVFGGAINQNLGTYFDKMFSKITGTRTIGKDESWKTFSKEQVKVADEAMLKAILNVLYDVNVDSELNGAENASKYENTGANWFKMAGNSPVEKLLAQYQMLIRAALVVPDEIAKARIRSGQETLPVLKKTNEGARTEAKADKYKKVAEGITPEAKAELSGDADSQAKYRTFQSENGVTSVVGKARDWANKKTGIGKDPNHKIGLGDIAIPFAKVPVNVALHKVATSPIGWVDSFLELGKGIKAAKNGELTAKKQAEISRKLGRTVNSVGLAIAGYILSSIGLIGNAESGDDDDKKALMKDEGVDGFYINLSALGRALSGGSKEYQMGDIVIDNDWLEILSVPISFGAFVQQSVEDNMTVGELLDASIRNTLDGLKNMSEELPGMNAINSIFTGYEYGGTSDVLGTFAASTAAGFMFPNAVTQTAAGIDNTARDVYNTDSAWETALNILAERSGILRGLVDPQLDSWGNEKKYGYNSLFGFLNKTLLPGAVNWGDKTAVDNELARLSDAGYSNIYPDRNPPSEVKADGENFKLTADERRQYNKDYGESLEKAYGQLMSDSYYANLSDDQKASALAKMQTYAAHNAAQKYLDNVGTDAELNRDKWETELSEKDAARYLVAKEVAKSLFTDGNPNDYDALDKFLNGVNSMYGGLTADSRKLLDNSYPNLDKMYEASLRGIDSKTFATASSIQKLYAEASGSKTDNAEDLKTMLANMKGVNERQAEWLMENFKIWQTFPVSTETYDKLVAGGKTLPGTTHKSANAVMDALGELEPATGYKTVQASQKYQAIAECNITDNEKWRAFFAMIDTSESAALQKDFKEGKYYFDTGRSFADFVKYSWRCRIKEK